MILIIFIKIFPQNLHTSMNHTLLRTIHTFQMTQWCHVLSQIIFTFILAPVVTLRISHAVTWQKWMESFYNTLK